MPWMVLNEYVRVLPPRNEDLYESGYNSHNSQSNGDKLVFCFKPESEKCRERLFVYINIEGLYPLFQSRYTN